MLLFLSLVVINIVWYLVAPEVVRSHYGIYSNELTCDVRRAYPSPALVWQYQEYSCLTVDVFCMPSDGWYNLTAADATVG